MGRASYFFIGGGGWVDKGVRRTNGWCGRMGGLGK